MALTVAELDAKLTLDDSGFRSGLGQAESGIDRLRQRGEGLKSVGDKMTRNVTLPIVGVGVAAGKLAMDFDSSMSRIVGLVGVASDEVDVMRDGVLDLAGETTKSPQELADALFTITSAGFRGSEAMDVLELSAKASAAGLGETRDIAEAVTATINTYGSDVIDAAKATDVLVATARAGNFATEDLAGGLGRVLPNAKAAQVSFEDLGGTIALLTRQNNDANQSITQADALFRAFVKPSAAARDTLESIGLTADKVRESFGEQGLHPTLVDLEERLIAQTGSTALAREELGKIIEDSAGFSAVLQLLDGDLETIDGTIGVTNDSTGMLADAWAAFAGSDSFEARRALAELQTALIRLGEVILPVAGKVFGFAADFFSAFSELPEPVLALVIAFAGLVAAVGPVLGIVGRVMILMSGLGKAFVTAKTAVTGMSISAGGAAAALGAVGIAVAAVTLLWQDHNARAAASKARQDELKAALQETNGALEGQAAEVVNNTLVSDKLRGQLVGLGISQDDLIAALDGGDESWAAFLQRIMDAKDAGEITQDEWLHMMLTLGRVGKEAAGASEAFKDNAEFTEEAGDAADEAAGGFSDLEGDVQLAADALDAANEALDEMISTINEALDSSFSLEEALIAQQALFDQASEQVAEHGTSLDINTEAGRNNRGMLMDLVRQHADVVESLAETVDSEEEFERQSKASRLATLAQMRQLGFTEDQIASYAAELDNVDAVVDTDVILNASAARNEVEAFKRVLDSIPRFVTTTVSTVTSFGSSVLERRAHGGPVRRGRPYVVGEDQPELFVPDEDGVILPHVPASFDPGMLGGGTLTAPAPTATATTPAMGAGGVWELRITGSGAVAEQVKEGVRKGEIQLVDSDGNRVSLS